MVTTEHPRAGELLGGLGVFRALSGDDLRWLGKIARDVRYPAGAVLFEQGSASEFFFVIQTGSVRLIEGWTPGGASGREVRVLTAGQGFGEVEVADNRCPPRPVTGIALEECLVLQVQRDAFDKLMDRKPDIMLKCCTLHLGARPG